VLSGTVDALAVNLAMLHHYSSVSAPEQHRRERGREAELECLPSYQLNLRLLVLTTAMRRDANVASGGSAAAEGVHASDGAGDLASTDQYL
jgi:hypothetical protein